MQAVDTLINAGWIVPVEPDGVILEGHCLIADRGRIEALLPRDDVPGRYHAAEVVELPGHVLIPGLVNAHTHAAMSLFKGLADDLPLTAWLQEHIWPAEARWVSDAFVRDGTRLAVAEMLRGGTTCFNDMYFYPEDAARAAAEAGMRATVGLIVLDSPTVWASGADEYLAKGIEAHDRIKSHALIHTAFAPHAPYTVSDEPLERIRTLADELDIPVHMHVHETAEEVDRAQSQHGERPLARLDRLGLLSDRLVAVHMTQLEDAEIQRIAQTGAHVVHCPESNLKLASGHCPVGALLTAGVNIALGTDGAASNNDLSMLGEMRTASLLAKGVSGDAAVLSARAALRIATLGGARSLGLEDTVGTLEPGKAADVVAVDLAELETQPVYNPVSQLVYAASAAQVSDVWIGGRQVLKNRALLTMDAAELVQTARAWRDRIASGRAP